MKNETLKQYESRVGTTVTQPAITKECAANANWIDRLRNSPLNWEVETRQDRNEQLARAILYVKAWRKKVTSWGFTV